jgi:hypothetical protein
MAIQILQNLQRNRGMGKNVTVQVDDELATKMEKLPDVNWSQVVRSSLDEYCNSRLEIGGIVKSLLTYLRGRLPDKEKARKLEVERFEKKWGPLGPEDIKRPDDSPGAGHPYVFLEKKIDIKPESTVLATLRVLNGVRLIPQEDLTFDPNVWKKHAFGQMENIAEGLRQQGFTVGERLMLQSQVIQFVADGSTSDGKELSRLYNHIGLWAVDQKDTILIDYRQGKR